MGKTEGSREELFAGWRGTKALSVEVVRGFLFFSGVLLAGATLLTLAAQFTGTTFRIYSVACWLWLIVSLSGSIWAFGPSIEDVAAIDWKPLLGLLAVSILGAGISLFTHRPDPDDFFYVPNAVYYLQNPGASMGLKIHFLENGYSNVRSFFWGTSISYDYLRAAISWGIGSKYLPIYYLWSAAVVAFTIPLSIFYLLTRFTYKTDSAVFGTAFAVAVLLLMGDTHRTPGNFAFTRAFQGKTVLLVAGIPLFSAVTIDFYRQRSWFNWLFLFTAATGLLGTTSSSVVLIPALGSVLTIAFLCIGLKWSRIVQWGLQYGSTFAFLFVYAGLALPMSFHELGPGSSVNKGWPTTFWGHLAFFVPHESASSVSIGGSEGPKGLTGYLSYVSYLKTPVTLLLILISTGVAAWVSRRKMRWFLGGWIGALFIFYLNPLVSHLHIKYTTSPNAYWRLFYIYPYVVLIGIFGFWVYGKLKMRYSVSIIAVMLVIPHIYGVKSSAIEGHLTRESRVDLPLQALQVSRTVSEKAPPGPMLAPAPLYGIIPMVDSTHPQVCTRDFGMRLWLESDRAEERLQACRFVGGNTQQVSGVKKVLGRNDIESILIKESAVEKKGFEEVLGEKEMSMNRIGKSDFYLVELRGQE